MTGFISFQVLADGTVNVAARWGCIETVELKALGAFGFGLSSEGETEHYQVCVSNDDPDLPPFSWSIAYRSGTRLVLEFKKLMDATPVPYNPTILCTVTVERMPTE